MFESDSFFTVKISNLVNSSDIINFFTIFQIMLLFEKMKESVLILIHFGFISFFR